MLQFDVCNIVKLLIKISTVVMTAAQFCVQTRYKNKFLFSVSHQLPSIWQYTAQSTFRSQLLPSQFLAILNAQLSKQERVGINEVGPIRNLATCKDAIQIAVQKRSSSQRKQKFVDLYLSDRER